MLKSKLPSYFYDFTALDENIIGVGQGNKWVRGKDTGEKALVILVKKKYLRKDLQREQIIPQKVDDILTDIIEVGDIRFFNGRTEFQRPCQPGMSIGHYKVSAGTLGAIVKDRDSGDPLILSNNHVLANLSDGSDGNCQIGDSILQPGLFDGGDLSNTIATLARYAPLYHEVITPKCCIAKYFEHALNFWIAKFKPQYRIKVIRQSEKFNLVDCAVAKPINSELIQSDILEIGAIGGVKNPEVAMLVKKSGRTTGLTYSIILATDVTVKVFMTDREYGIFSDQIIAGPMSMPGDSGSLVLSEDNYAVGLLFAGSEQVTIINHITNVCDALNIEF